MAADESAQGLGHGEGEHEVVGGQLALELAGEPGIGLGLLAAWTVAIAAAARQQLRLGARLTAIEQSAAGLRAAGDDRLDDFLVLGGHARGEAREVARAVGEEDLLDGAHDHRSSITALIRA